jgi:death-on-curing protein
MQHIFPELREDYQRWRRALRLDDGGEVPYRLTIDSVLRAHYLLCDYFMREGEDIAAVGPRDTILLGSAVSRQGTQFENVQKWQGPLEQVATVFYGLVKNHAFHDGNKRTALLVALHHLTKFGKVPTGEQRAFEALAVDAASDRLRDYSSYSTARRKYADEHDRRVFVIARFLRSQSRDVDKRFVSITFRELDTILHRFGFRLGRPDGNFIDVLQDVETKTFLGLRRRTEVRRVVQIGFPGWTREVNQNAIREVRRATRLTAEYDCDSQVFFRGSDSIAGLISRYHGTLLRLKDR